MCDLTGRSTHFQANHLLGAGLVLSEQESETDNQTHQHGAHHGEGGLEDVGLGNGHNLLNRLGHGGGGSGDSGGTSGSGLRRTANREADTCRLMQQNAAFATRRRHKSWGANISPEWSAAEGGGALLALRHLAYPFLEHCPTQVAVPTAPRTTSRALPYPYLPNTTLPLPCCANGIPCLSLLHCSAPRRVKAISHVRSSGHPIRTLSNGGPESPLAVDGGVSEVFSVARCAATVGFRKIKYEGTNTTDAHSHIPSRSWRQGPEPERHGQA